jgi:hypothetical protein
VCVGPFLKYEENINWENHAREGTIKLIKEEEKQTLYREHQ